jgi:hypothetical protein
LVSYDSELVTALSSGLVQACGRLRDLGRMPGEVVVRDPHLVATPRRIATTVHSSCRQPHHRQNHNVIEMIINIYDSERKSK